MSCSTLARRRQSDPEVDEQRDPDERVGRDHERRRRQLLLRRQLVDRHEPVLAAAACRRWPAAAATPTPPCPPPRPASSHDGNPMISASRSDHLVLHDSISQPRGKPLELGALAASSRTRSREQQHVQQHERRRRRTRTAPRMPGCSVGTTLVFGCSVRQKFTESRRTARWPCRRAPAPARSFSEPGPPYFRSEQVGDEDHPQQQRRGQPRVPLPPHAPGLARPERPGDQHDQRRTARSARPRPAPSRSAAAAA